MRPICFVILMIVVVPAGLAAQDPLSSAMRTAEWPASVRHDEGFGWSVFSRQYYCVSNWNASGFSADYSTAMGQSTALICRDGIPGYSWYHLYLSHYQNFKTISGMIQLRFSLLGLKDRPMALRLGGNIRINWPVSQTLQLQVGLYDFTGWFMPGAAVTRGDPSMQVHLFHEPGRLIGLITGFRLNPSQFGPVTAGIRLNINDQVGLTGLIDVLPFGVSLGINYRLNRYVLNCWLEHKNGMGLTPMVQISGD